MSNQTPEYLKFPTLSLHRHLYGVRSGNVLKDIECETPRYRNSFFPDSVSMWNDLGPDLRGSESISKFKESLLPLYRPVKKTIFNAHDPGIKWIFQLRVGLSPLKSHKKSHKFAGYEHPYSDTCSCTMGAESTAHFLLYCPNFTTQRKVLYGTVNPILLTHNTQFFVGNLFVQLLLYGDEKFNLEENQNFLKTTIKFIRDTNRFSQI